MRDLMKPAFRQFRDHPLYALATVATLALAIGVGAVTFSVVKRAYLAPLPYRDDARLHSLLTSIDQAVRSFRSRAYSTGPVTRALPARPCGRNAQMHRYSYSNSNVIDDAKCVSSRDGSPYSHCNIERRSRVIL